MPTHQQIASICPSRPPAKQKNIKSWHFTKFNAFFLSTIVLNRVLSSRHETRKLVVYRTRAGQNCWFWSCQRNQITSSIHRLCLYQMVGLWLKTICYCISFESHDKTMKANFIDITYLWFSLQSQMYHEFKLLFCHVRQVRHWVMWEV